MSDDYQQPDGTPKATGRTLHESIAHVRIDDSPEANGRVVIHVEHPDHDEGTRAFYRHRDSDVAATIRSHLETEIDADLTRVTITDSVGIGLVERELVPGDGATASTEIEVVSA